MIFLRYDRVGSQRADLDAGSRRRTLDQPHKLIQLFFFRYNGFQSIQLLSSAAISSLNSA